MTVLIACFPLFRANSLRNVTNTTDDVIARLVLEVTTAQNPVSETCSTNQLCLANTSVCGGLSDGPNRPVRNGTTCDCEDGWGGINCNMCTSDESCDAFMPEGLKGTCYTGGILVNKNHQMCNVTNRKILDILKGQIPQVTFSCNQTAKECNFQFWVDQRESFFCGLDECEFTTEMKGSTNITTYHCPNVHCKCVPDRMLCGEAGSIDISDFLTETIKGPGDFECDLKKQSCKFSEPSMNDLIKSVFGDPMISLDCQSSECAHYTELPGRHVPEKTVDRKFIIGSLVGVVSLLVVGGLVYRLMISASSEKFSSVRLPLEDSHVKLMAEHNPASLQFSQIGYRDKDKQILEGAMGSVEPGQILAIMGGSGAGKTTLLDILAKKTKRGVQSGLITVNGREVSDRHYRRVIGFVDQDDYMMPTLTVYETIVNSALLRLPKSMSDDSKKLRAMETMAELGILSIKDQLIGNESNRGISGGEKRRVAIACELVTSPSILFLDEPTSGLDSYNAYNVVESLVHLARDFNRTVVFTIHQPRSNIVALFDKLVLLAQGKLVYSGTQLEAAQFFSELGYPCPAGFNVADFLVDLTMKATGTVTAGGDEGETIDQFAALDDTRSEEERLHNPLPRSSSQDIDTTTEWLHFASHRDEGRALPTAPTARSVSLDSLVDSYAGSAMAEMLNESIESIRQSADDESDSNSIEFKGRDRINVFKQFSILSKRTFKNLYRNPMLLLTHYIIAIFLALFCGVLYFNISDDISGFQNRLGLFFFLLTLFGFSTLTTLSLFAEERVIFVRERANGYYKPIAYYASKVLFDIVPLRVFPPIILGLILYPLVGLSFDSGAFWKFLLILVLFNLTAAATCLLIGVLIQDTGVANLVGCLVMLFSLLFAGLFLNHDSMPKGTVWFQYVSIFHYAYEALAVNEVRYLTLTERKYGLSIEIPGATILSTFGFDSGAFTQDLIGLLVIFGLYLSAGYVAMHFLLVERR